MAMVLSNIASAIKNVSRRLSLACKVVFCSERMTNGFIMFEASGCFATYSGESKDAAIL